MATLCGNQYIDLLYEPMDWFLHGVVFNAKGYFRYSVHTRLAEFANIYMVFFLS